MTEPIRLYYRNVLTDAVGPEHGLGRDDLKGLAARLVEITRKLNQQRLPYRDLPYQLDNARKIRSLADSLRPRFDSLVVMGIGGSALGNIALQTALNSPMYNLQMNRPGPRLFVMDNVDPVQFGDLLDWLGPQL
jgi:glucose-6-phosphate isomerase